MSFFDDEEDEWGEERPSSRAAAAEPRPRPRPRSGGSSGGSRSGGPRRGGTDPAIERRRLVAIGVIVVVVILMIVLISSCQSSSTRHSLEDYNNSVSSLIDRSDATGQSVFHALASGDSPSQIQQDLAGSLQSANGELSDAENLGVPGQMSQAQSHLLLALRMRRDGISTIANIIDQATGSGSSAKSAVNTIALGTARFYASDVIYKGYVGPEIASALHGDNIAVGGSSNIQINGGQFLNNLGWLQTSYIATTLGVQGVAGAGGQNSTAKGIHGDALVSTAVNGTTLSKTGTNTVAGSPAPSFTLSVSDGGQFNQYGIKCSVSVSGGPSGSGTLSQITAGSTSTCNVKLSGTVTPGTYQVTVKVGAVPGETNLTNNTQTYSIQFQ